ncbi:BON domain-containing protein [Nocardia sp. CA2R105]|nr:BON domain-containing protein [Nocardia coffeae]
MLGHHGDVTTDDLSPQYSAANLRRALAEDPRTAELDVRVSVRDHAVVLCGEVGSAQRRLQLDDIVRENAPKLRVHNDIRVTTPDIPASHEQLD